MFDFNCNVALELQEDKAVQELEMAKYMSSINICTYAHSGDPLRIKRALEFAREKEVAIGALVGYLDIDGFGYSQDGTSDEELEALIMYQIGSIEAYARALGLEMELVRCGGVMQESLNKDVDFAKKIALIVKKFSPWLTLVLGNSEIKKVIEKEVKIRCAYEVSFGEKSSIRELREMEQKPDTVHFSTVEDAKRAWEVIKPSPVGFNRVKSEL